MDYLLSSLTKFKLTNDKEKFEEDLDDVINKFNQQEIVDCNYEWETICSNYSKLLYLDEITRNYYTPESEKFLLILEKFMKNIDNVNKKYVREICWESYKDQLNDVMEIKNLLDLSIKETDPIAKMRYCLKCYVLFVSLIEDYRDEHYKYKIDDQKFIEDFNFKRRKLN